MLTEEIGLNAALQEAGLEVVETDLGEWILQLLGQRPSHILAPAVHVSRRGGRGAVQPSAPATAVSTAADTSADGRLRPRRRCARRSSTATSAITGVNLAVAQTGTIVLVESEGNIRLCLGPAARATSRSWASRRSLRDWDGAAHLVQMLPLAAHGRPAATYTSFITGVGDDDGPDELHVVLVDDGRSAPCAAPTLESALHCIRCGACLYACPVYRQVGGHAYGAAYSGPIGAVITPALEGSAPPSDELPWLSLAVRRVHGGVPGRHPARRAPRHPARPRAARRPRRVRVLGGVVAAVGAPVDVPGDGARRPARRSSRFSRRVDGSARPLAWTDGRDVRAPAAEPFHARWRTARRGPR